jgi:hypothetical protein
MRVYRRVQSSVVDMTDADVDQLVLETNQAREVVRALRARVHRLWNQAAHGNPHLSAARGAKLSTAECG